MNVDWEYRENLSEKIRLLYVALTRTREKMIFILPEGELEEKNNPGSFADLLRPFTRDFTTIKRKVSSDLILPKIREKEIERKKIDLKEIHFSYKEINEVHASKDLRINTNKYILEYGRYLHELMEIIDFYNPDLSIIAYTSLSFERQTVKVSEVQSRYFYPQSRVGKLTTGCYNCIVNASGDYDIDSIISGQIRDFSTGKLLYDKDKLVAVRRAFLSGLARERRDLYKSNFE